MGECFELTFFVEKTQAVRNNDKKRFLQELNLKQGKNQINEHQVKLFKGREIFLEFYEESDFIGFWISITNLTFTKKNFNNKLDQIFEVVLICFKNITSIIFATGIYQLTYDYVREIRYIAEFNKMIFANFPFVFFREGNDYEFIPTYQREDVTCIVNLKNNVQDIFANPISELMEDEGLSFEEAKKRVTQDFFLRRQPD